jgi:hypothetical protein
MSASVQLADTSGSRGTVASASRRDRVVAALRVIRWPLLGCYGLVFLAVTRRSGLDLEREIVLAWLAGGMAITTLGASWRRTGWIVLDWVPLALLFVAYDYTRGAADTLGLPVHERLPVAIDKALFFGHVPTVVLQQWLGPFDGSRWWEMGMSITYMTHFFLPLSVAAVLWVVSRDAWKAFFVRFMSLTMIGLATYVLVPWTPPWLAAKDGLIDPVQRSTNFGWRHIGLHFAEQVINKGSATVNVVAALPSLHAAYAMLIAVFLWRRVPAWVRPILAVYPLAMAFTLVIGAEHWVFDILLGWAYVVVVMRFWGRVEGSRIPAETSDALGGGAGGTDGGNDVDQVPRVPVGV